MALARVRADGLLEFVESTGDEIGFQAGDQVRVERIGDKPTCATSDPGQDYIDAFSAIHAYARSGDRVDPATLPPISPAEEEAVARYERVTERFRTSSS